VEGFKKDTVLMELFDDGLPKEQQLAATEGANVGSSFDENGILQLVTDGSESYLIRADSSSVVR